MVDLPSPAPPDKELMDQAHAGQQGEALKKKLGLTDDQAGKLKALHANNREKTQAIRENQSLTKEQRREQMMALRTSQEQEMKNILTPDQYTQFVQMREQGKEKMKKMRKADKKDWKRMKGNLPDNNEN